MDKNKKVNEKVFENLIIAVVVILYFIIINFSYYRIAENWVVLETKIISLVLLLFSITIFEISYKKDSGKIAINGIEVLILASHALSIMQVVQITKINFPVYILMSSGAFAIYYILKAIILYTIDKRNYLKNLSDIKEIVNTQPIKKEAKKRK